MVNESTKEKTILVIEDERPLVEAIKTKLENSGPGVNKYYVKAEHRLDEIIN